MKRLAKFFRGEATVAAYFWRDSDESKNELSENRINITQVPKYTSIINPETLYPYFVEYERLDQIGAFRSPDTVVRDY